MKLVDATHKIHSERTGIWYTTWHQPFGYKHEPISRTMTDIMREVSSLKRQLK